MNIFDVVLIQPLFNLLIFFYEVIPGRDLGIAIIALTVLIRLLFWPLTAKALHSQRALQGLQPDVARLKERHKGNSQELNKALMELYKEKEVNPFSSCLPMLIQLPFLFALFYVFRIFQDGLSGEEAGRLLYAVTPEPGTVDTHFLGLIDLAHQDPILFLPLAAAALQFVQVRMVLPREYDKTDIAQSISRQMVFIMPVITIAFGFVFPAALFLYWGTFSLISIIQQRIIMGREVHVIEEVAAAAPAPAAPAVERRTATKKGVTVTVERRSENPPTTAGHRSGKSTRRKKRRKR